MSWNFVSSECQHRSMYAKNFRFVCVLKVKLYCKLENISLSKIFHCWLHWWKFKSMIFFLWLICKLCGKWWKLTTSKNFKTKNFFTVNSFLIYRSLLSSCNWMCVEDPFSQIQSQTLLCLVTEEVLKIEEIFLALLFAMLSSKLNMADNKAWWYFTL